MPNFMRRSRGDAGSIASVDRTSICEPEIKLRSEVWGYPDALHFHGSVIPRIALPVAVVTLWSVMWYLIGTYALSGIKAISIQPTFITIISLVLSLLLVFRTNTAYERYWEGRKLWGTLIVSCRNLSRFIWVGVEQRSEQDFADKKAAVQIVLAFFIATKNHLRMEFGLKDSKGHWREDLVALIPAQRRKDLHARDDRRRSREATGHGNFLSVNVQNMPPSLHRRGSTASGSASAHSFTSVSMPPGVSPLLCEDRTNLPVDLSHLLSAYIISQRKRDRIDVPQFSAMINILSSMVDVLTNLERILTSPIPLAYNIHLKQALYIYLLMLPFQLYQQFDALAVLIVALAAFTLLGVESIGAEIENPFGFDKNDLPLDLFVANMREELETLVASPPVSLADWELAVDGPDQLAAGSSTGPPQMGAHLAGAPAAPAVKVLEPSVHSASQSSANSADALNGAKR